MQRMNPAEKIAEVLRAHAVTECWWKCDGGTAPLSTGWHERHVAAEVVAALGLTEEWAHTGRPWPDEDPQLDEWSCGHEIITPTPHGVVHHGYDTRVRRYVTAWDETEENH